MALPIYTEYNISEVPLTLSVLPWKNQVIKAEFSQSHRIK